jgi:hypothetical protein
MASGATHKREAMCVTRFGAGSDEMDPQAIFQAASVQRMLAADPAGGSPAGGNCPAATVVKLSDEKGDRRCLILSRA